MSTATTTTVTAEQIEAGTIQVGDVVATTKTAIVAGKGEQVAQLNPGTSAVRILDAAGKTIGRPKKVTKMWRVASGEPTEAPAETPAVEAPAEKPKKPAAKKAATTDDAPVGEQGFEWPKAPAQVLLDYLKSEVSDAADAPNRSKPFISSNGLLRLHSSDWREWLVAQGMAPSKAEAAKVLRDAGLKPQAFALPGEGRSLGFYTGAALKGTEKLPRRVVVRAASSPRNPFAKLSADERAFLADAVEAYKVDGDALKIVRASMLAKLAGDTAPKS